MFGPLRGPLTPWSSSPEQPLCLCLRAISKINSTDHCSLNDWAENNIYDVQSHVQVHNDTNRKRLAYSSKVTATSTEMQDLESHETSGLLPKQSPTNETQPKRRAVALTIVVALVATTALVNLCAPSRVR